MNRIIRAQEVHWYDDIQGGDWVIIALLAVAGLGLICAVFSPQLTASVAAAISGAFGGASGYASRAARSRKDDAVATTDCVVEELQGLESLRRIEEGQHDGEIEAAVAAAAADVADDGLDDLVSRANRIIRGIGTGDQR